MLGNFGLRGLRSRLSRKTAPNSETEKENLEKFNQNEKALAAEKTEALNVFGLLIEKNRTHEVRKVLSFLDGMVYTS